MVRNLVDCETGFLLGYKYLIQDRGTAFTKDFRELLGNSGVRSIRLPRKSPNLNCYAERWVRSVREMCVDRMIFFGEKSLRHAMSEVEKFYNHECPHQGLENKIIQPDFDKPKKEGDIEFRSRLGGLMKYYFRKAA